MATLAIQNTPTSQTSWSPFKNITTAIQSKTTAVALALFALLFQARPSEAYMGGIGEGLIIQSTNSGVNEINLIAGAVIIYLAFTTLSNIVLRLNEIINRFQTNVS